MPLSLFVPLVVLGIAAIIGALHLAGRSAPRPLTREEAARLWNDEYPGSPARAVHLAADALSALVETAQGPGVVWVLGQDRALRPVAAPRLAPRGDALELRLPDFTAPRVTLRPAPDEAPRWRRLLEGPSQWPI